MGTEYAFDPEPSTLTTRNATSAMPAMAPMMASTRLRFCFFCRSSSSWAACSVADWGRILPVACMRGMLWVVLPTPRAARGVVGVAGSMAVALLTACMRPAR